MSGIYLITDVFPYGIGEQFLEAEVPYLAREAKLTIMPKSIQGKSRPLPSGVSLDHTLIAPKSTVSRHINVCGEPAFFQELKRRFKTLLSARDIKKLHALVAHGVFQYKQLLEIRSDFELESTVLYSYWSWETAFAFSLLKNDLPELPMVSRAHRYDIYGEVHINEYMPFNKSYLNKLDLICTVSTHGKKYLQHKYGLSGSNIEVCRLGVEDPGIISRFNTNGEVHIVSCSYVKKVKRLDRLVEALNHLEGQVQVRIRWTHIGDGDERAFISSLANQLLTKTEVNWMGQITNEEVRSLYEAEVIDCFVNTSDSEGIPVSIMEALSFGIPVVATRVGGVPEIINNNNGKLVEAGCSSEKLSEAILEVIRKNTTLYRQSIRKLWHNNYNAGSNYPRFAKTLVALAQKSAL